MRPSVRFDATTVDGETVFAGCMRVATALRDAGLRPGDVVAVMLRNEPAAIEVILATRHLGAYWCGLNWHFKADEARWILQDSGAKVLVIHADLLAQIEGGIPEGVRVLVVTPRSLTRRVYGLTEDPQVPSAQVDWDTWLASQVASTQPPQAARGFMPYTSGTTGRPKGVRRLVDPDPTRRQAQLEAAAQLGRTVFGIDAASVCLLAAPLYHSAPASYATFCAQAGATLRLEPRFDAQRLLELIGHDQTTHLYLVPTMYQRLLRLPASERSRHDVASVRFVASTGSPCPPRIKQAMIDWWGPVIHEAYASSETGYVTLITADEWLAHPGSAGRPVGPALLKIFGDDGQLLPPGEIGTIYARQPAYPDFDYAHDPAARRAIERDGLFTLGDMGYVDADGYLYLVDRQSDMVISGGVNIYPAEIEAALHDPARRDRLRGLRHSRRRMGRGAGGRRAAAARRFAHRRVVSAPARAPGRLQGARARRVP